MASTPENSFTPIDNVGWLSTPAQAGQYARWVYERRKRFRQEGSILPLPLARMAIAGAVHDKSRDEFELVTSTVAHEIEVPRLYLLRRSTESTGQKRPSLGWHADRPAKFGALYGFKFLWAVTENPRLTTRFAPPGSPTVSSYTTLHATQPAPQPEDIVYGSGDVIYLMPVLQTVHASPEQPSNDEAMLLGRFVYFAFANADSGS